MKNRFGSMINPGVNALGKGNMEPGKENDELMKNGFAEYNRIALLYVILFTAVFPAAAQTGVKEKRTEISLRNGISVNPTRYAFFPVSDRLVELPVAERFSKDMTSLSLRYRFDVNKYVSFCPELGLGTVRHNQYNLWDTAISVNLGILRGGIRAYGNLGGGATVFHQVFAAAGLQVLQGRKLNLKESGRYYYSAGYLLRFLKSGFSLGASLESIRSELWYRREIAEGRLTRRYDFSLKRKRTLLQLELIYAF